MVGFKLSKTLLGLRFHNSQLVRYIRKGFLILTNRVSDGLGESVSVVVFKPVVKTSCRGLIILVIVLVL